MTTINHVNELPALRGDSTRVCLKHEGGTWLCGQWSGTTAISDAGRFIGGYLLEGREYGFTSECLIEGSGFHEFWAKLASRKVATAIRALAQVISTACM